MKLLITKLSMFIWYGKYIYWNQYSFQITSMYTKRLFVTFSGGKLGICITLKTWRPLVTLLSLCFPSLTDRRDYKAKPDFYIHSINLCRCTLVNVLCSLPTTQGISKLRVIQLQRKLQGIFFQGFVSWSQVDFLHPTMCKQILVFIYSADQKFGTPGKNVH